MLDLFDLTLILLFASAVAWLWRGHGIRERALALVRRHCEKAEIILLDENVALKGWRLQHDSRNRRRLARVYGFEFTVTGEQRHVGTISMFGQHLGNIELAAHPFHAKAHSDAPVAELFYPADAPQADPQRGQATNGAAVPNIIQLSDWRQRQSGSDKQH